jgi:hypothetical protein
MNYELRTWHLAPGGQQREPMSYERETKAAPGQHALGWLGVWPMANGLRSRPTQVCVITCIFICRCIVLYT